jgi:gas vesicle protein GvpO
MAERRSARTKRRPRDEEPAQVVDDELAEEPEDELADDPDDELADDPEDELADDPEDELADDPDDELAEEPEDELADDPDDELAEDAGQASGDDDRGARRRSRRGRSDGLTAAKASQAALRQIAELTGKSPEGVTGVDPADDGWVVGVEVVEDRRIPSSTDILATYETELDMDGELVSYRRVRRYPRGRGDDEDA